MNIEGAFKHQCLNYFYLPSKCSYRGLLCLVMARKPLLKGRHALIAAPPCWFMRENFPASALHLLHKIKIFSHWINLFWNRKMFICVMGTGTQGGRWGWELQRWPLWGEAGTAPCQTESVPSRDCPVTLERSWWSRYFPVDPGETMVEQTSTMQPLADMSWRNCSPWRAHAGAGLYWKTHGEAQGWSREVWKGERSSRQELTPIPHLPALPSGQKVEELGVKGWSWACKEEGWVEGRWLMFYLWLILIENKLK